MIDYTKYYETLNDCPVCVGDVVDSDCQTCKGSGKILIEKSKEPEMTNPKKYSGISTRWIAWKKGNRIL